MMMMIRPIIIIMMKFNDIATFMMDDDYKASW